MGVGREGWVGGVVVEVVWRREDGGGGGLCLVLRRFRINVFFSFFLGFLK